MHGKMHGRQTLRLLRTALATIVIALSTLGLLAVAGCSEAEQAADEILRELETAGEAVDEATTQEQASGSGLSTATGAPVPPSGQEAAQLLAGLTVEPVGSMSGYSRDLFPHWSSDATIYGWSEPDGSCDVRDAALVRDGEGVRVDEDCSFIAGEWIGPYTGQTFIDTEDVDIDHVVPLANAWRSGASTWSTPDREAYANDPQVLLTVDDSANQEKGDKGPDAWKPPNQSYWCEYSRRWVDVKSTWGLTVNSPEKAALEEMLGTCERP